jgi:hypothetical protein
MTAKRTGATGEINQSPPDEKPAVNPAGFFIPPVCSGASAPDSKII